MLILKNPQTKINVLKRFNFIRVLNDYPYTLRSKRHFSASANAPVS